VPEPKTVFEAVEFGWIVAAGDHHAAIGFRVHGGVVEQGGGLDANIGDVTAAGLEAEHQGIAQAGRAEPRVAGQREMRTAMAPQVGSEGLAKRGNVLTQKFASATPRISYSRKMVDLSMVQRLF